MENDPHNAHLETDWRYLLYEVYNLYRFSSAAGSGHIRSHQKDVRHRLSRLLRQDFSLQQKDPAEKPVCVHLSRALDLGLSHSTAPLCRSIERIRQRLCWEYGYEKLPSGLSSRYAFSVLAGPQGPVTCAELVIGLVLFAPGTTYPNHSHQDLAESYFCLSGSISENDVGVYVPGSLILNPPGHPHRITTSDVDPSLLAYAWVGAPEALAYQKMSFCRKSK